MTFPTITAFYAAILGLIYAGLAIWVIAGRVTDDALFGNGDDSLTRRIRSHGNFAEYVPIALLLIAFLESSGGSALRVRTLLIILVVARLLHPVGMFAAKNSAQQFVCRGGGIIATIGVVVAASISLLMR